MGTLAEEWLGDDYFHGKMDDLRIYNRALAASEVHQLNLHDGSRYPIIANLRTSQQSGTKLVNIIYDVVDGDSSRLNVSVAVSTNNGTSYNLPAISFSGTGYGPSVTPGNNRQIVWNAGADWNNQLSSQVRFRVTASDGSGSSPADSAAVTVDTRDGNRPVVQEVKSAYCDGMKHAYFLNGVSLPLEFEVVPNWNGKTPGSIKFIGPWGTHTQPGTQTKRTYNVGTDFGVGNHLTVKLVAADGTESLPQQVNFDIIFSPPWVPVGILHPIQVSGITDLKYGASSKQVFNFWGEDKDSIPKDDQGNDIPYISGNPLKWEVGMKVLFEVSGSGVASGVLEYRDTSKPWNILGHQITPPTVYGGMEARFVDDWSLIGKGGIKVTFDAQTPPGYLWYTPPVYVRAGVGLTLAAEGKFGWDSNRGVVWSLGLPGNVIVTVTGGCGINGALAAEVFGGGGPYWNLQLVPDPHLVDYGVEFRYGLRLVALFYQKEYAFEYSLSLLPSPSPVLEGAFGLQEATRQMNRPDAQEWKLLPRDYLSASTPYGVFFRKPPVLLRWGDPVVAQVPMVLQTNIFPYSEPSLAVSGTNRMLLLVTDNTNRAPENRTEVIWSKWNGSTWVNPTSVWNDATADFSPTVKLFPDGSALAVWANEKAVLTNNAPLDVALAGLEIAAARFNPTNQHWTAANLTSNDHLDRSAQLAAATNGTALLTWIQNTNNSVLGVTNALNVVQARLWDGANWQSAGTIGPDPGMLLWSTVAYNGTNGVFLAAIDPDDDQSTTADQELWGATFGGASWTPLARLTTNSVQDTKPQAVYDISNRLVVVWYQDTNLVMRIGDLNLGNPTVVGQLSGASSQKDFHLVAGPAGQISMVWEDLAADGSGPDPMLLNYDAALGAWSQPLRLLANTNQLERSFSGAYADNGSLLLAYNRVAVSYDTNNVPQFGAVDLMFLDYSIGSDLAVNSGDIGLSPNNPIPGQSVEITALVRNTGELAVTNVQVVFFDGNPASGGSLIGSTQTVPGVLAAGSNAPVQVTWVVPPTTTNRTLYVVVDPAQAQADRNRADNTTSLSVLAADLQISDITVLQPSATNRILNARCVNVGSIPSGRAVDVVFRRGATNGPILATVPIANLPTNGVYDASFEWDLAGLTFTNVFELIYATVDGGNLVKENDENNNARTVSVMTSLDSDGDGLLDGDEARYGTNPLLVDTDGDGLSDGEELRTHGTNPLLADTDGDGMSDGQELPAGTDPSDPISVFEISSVVRNSDGSVTLWWQSVPNKLYRLSRSLTPSRESFTTLTNGVVGTPPVNTFTDTTATDVTAFYWVELE